MAVVPLIYIRVRNQMRLEAKLGSKMVYFLVDTGATLSIVPLEVVKECGLLDCVKVGPNNLSVRNPISSCTPQIYGVLKAPIFCNNLKINPYFAVFDKGPLIIGMDVFSGYSSRLLLLPEDPRLELILRHDDRVSISKGYKVECTILGRPFLALADTGATNSYISIKTASDLKLNIGNLSIKTVETITGAAPIHGITKKVPATFLGQSVFLDLMVDDNDVGVILGLDALLGLTLSFAGDA